MDLRARWRSGRPEFLLLAGSVIGALGNVAWATGVIAGLPSSEWPWPLGLAVAGVVVSLVTPLSVRRRPRTAAKFLAAGVAASAVVVLTPPGVVGGGVALVGAVWGLLATAQPLDAQR